MEPIPGPPGWPLIGNLLDIELENTPQSFTVLAKEWGQIYKLYLGGTVRIFINSHELVDDVCSRKEFGKHIMGSIAALSKVLPDGLFTVDTAQETWGQGRRILNPAFTPSSIKNMFDEMLDITSQLALKWARHGPECPIDVSDDFTRLTLDTIALTAMDTRFNSFYHDDLHPFVQHFGGIFAEIQRRSNRPAWYTWMQWKANRQFDENSDFIRNFCADILTRRRRLESNESIDRKDVFTAMLHRRDPVTGKQLEDSVIIDNMITFLFAGHDTTAGLLSFLVYHLIKNPDAYAKVQEEIDRVLKGGVMTIDHLNALPYIKACLLEALRLEPPAQVFTVTPLINDAAPVIIGKRYAVYRGQTIVIFIPALHRDPAVFGDDADKFRPERMSEENFKKLPKHAFKPFGNSPRSCIGSDFAMQEAMVAAAVLFQKFDFSLVDPNYELQYQPRLQRRALNFFIKARLRPGVKVLSLHRDFFVPASKGAESE
ncbi:cytochrome P450 [Annulohypoxylon truncatum]|uniref:cytochrome P450 n=1 Tax=Annulohypoxylon truncatum TaxID=327061 RepID=UPI00200891A1|nr:cytochrome P450 [Annulohypoxylon truncatum]KAI1211604.1 cytochrome P450 [Annulohypoxylon truncatum]